MSQTIKKPKTIFFADGHSADETQALAMAAGLAKAADAELLCVHATSDETSLSDSELSQTAHNELALPWFHTVRVRRMRHTCCENVTDTLLDAISRHQPDLVVLGTHGRGQLSQLLSESVTESLVRNLSIPTLVVPLVPRRPELGEQLIDVATGDVLIRKLVVAAGDQTSQIKGLELASLMQQILGIASMPTQLACIGHLASHQPSDFPDLAIDSFADTDGRSVETSLLKLTEHTAGQLLIMATRGHDSISDAVYGSTFERVLRSATLPILTQLID